jgi:hypothetical protein
MKACDPSECWQLLFQWHSITTRQTSIFTAHGSVKKFVVISTTSLYSGSTGLKSWPGNVCSKFFPPLIIPGNETVATCTTFLVMHCSLIFVSYQVLLDSLSIGNPLKPNCYFMCHNVWHSTILHSAHTVYLCVLYGSQEKQRLISYAVLTVWFLQLWQSVFTAWHKMNL